MNIKTFKSLYKKYYYGRTIYPHTEFRVNKQNEELIERNLLKLLVEMTEFLEKNNIRYIISDGTLLGAYRKSSIIKGDDDIDMRIYKDDWNKFYKKIHKSKFFFNNYLISNSTFKPEDNRWLQIHCKIKTPAGTLHMDIVSSDLEARNPLTNEWAFKKADDNFSLPTEPITINNITVQGPNKKLIEPILKDYYGNDFMVEKSHTHNDRPLIIGINVALSFVLIVLSIITYKYNKLIFIPTIITILALIISSSINNF